MKYLLLVCFCSANEVKETKKDNQDVNLNQHKNKAFVEMNVVDRCGTTENNRITFNNGTQEVPHEIAGVFIVSSQREIILIY